MNHLRPLSIALVIMAFLFCMIEAITASPHYRLEPATVIEVTPDRVGYIGYEDNTWVRFSDGYTIPQPGRLGNAGDLIIAGRRDGVVTLLGVFGDWGLLCNKAPKGGAK
jgi:hypothetical protein